jgi:hypothetical protein
MIKFIKNNILKIIITKLFLLSIATLFIIQFQVAELKNELITIETDIASYEDDIKILDIEWVYLTRPQRLRLLASQHLQGSNYIKLSQMKEESQLTNYYITKYKSLIEQDYAYNY